MKKTCMAERVRVVAHSILGSPDCRNRGVNAQEVFFLDDITRILNLKTFADRRKVSDALRDGVRRGEYERLDIGTYRLAPHATPYAKKRNAMWSLIRAKKQHGNSITADDLVELCDVSRDYAKEFLHALARAGYLSRVGRPDSPVGHYRLIHDQVECPADHNKSARLRKIRADKKMETLAALNGAADLIAVTIAIIKERD